MSQLTKTKIFNQNPSEIFLILICIVPFLPVCSCTPSLFTARLFCFRTFSIIIIKYNYHVSYA